MNRSHFLWVLCFVNVFAVVAFANERSVSTSRQFLVYGSDLRLRGAICELAEATKKNMLALLSQRDAWRTPIIINAQLPQANQPDIPRSALTFSQTGFGLKIQLDLTIAADDRQPEIRRELLRASLIERMYRRQLALPAGTSYVSPPDWLLDGISAHDSNSDVAETLQVLSGPLAANKIIPLEEFLLQRPALLEVPARILYRAYSSALCELLVRTNDGRARLNRFIENLPSSSTDPVADFRAQFPELFASADEPENAWLTSVRRLVEGHRQSLLTLTETNRRLDEIARVKNYRLNEFPKFIHDPASKPSLIKLGGNLLALALRAHPIYVSVISEYMDITARLARGKTKGIANRLARVEMLRGRLATRAQQTEDYLNWFEATQSRAPSGAFADFLNAAQSSTTRELRRDPISLYLDALETEF